jgi:hypothetical protein
MLEVHGVADVIMGSDQIDVVVREQKNGVALAFQESSFRSRQVLLTAKQARKIAEHLIEAANRLDAQTVDALAKPEVGEYIREGLKHLAGDDAG